MILTYKYRLNLKQYQHKHLELACENSRVLYNAALQERIDAYKHGTKITKFDQYRSLTEIRADDLQGIGKYPATLGRWPLDRLDQAFKGFFSRLKKNGKGGFPRFRSKSQWNTFGLTEFNGIRIKKNRLSIKGILNQARIHLHRPISNCAELLSAQLTKKIGIWWICIQVELPDVERIERTGENSAGLDWGVANYTTSSNGTTVPGIKTSTELMKACKRTQRKLARCKRSSKGRKKIRIQLKRLNNTVVNARTTKLHQVSAYIVKQIKWLAMEKLSVKNMTASARGISDDPGTNVKQKSGLNRAILDEAPARLRTLFCYKTARAGGGVIEVDPKRASQQCFSCGRIVAKGLSERMHRCPCGWVLGRDSNAAYNIEVKAFGTSPGLDQALEKFWNRDVVIPELRLLDTDSVDYTSSVERYNQAVTLDVIRNINNILN